MIAKERLFESRGSLCSALATDVANALQHHVRTKGSACLAVSGGTTPKLFFETLSRIDIPWSKITVTLVDDRQVPETSPRSNAKLVRDNLLQNLAAGAEFEKATVVAVIIVALVVGAALCARVLGGQVGVRDMMRDVGFENARFEEKLLGTMGINLGEAGAFRA